MPRAVQDALELDVPGVRVEEDQVSLERRRDAKGADAGVTAESQLMAEQVRLQGDGLNGGLHCGAETGGSLRVFVRDVVPVALDVSDRRRADDDFHTASF